MKKVISSLFVCILLVGIANFISIGKEKSLYNSKYIQQNLYDKHEFDWKYMSDINGKKKYKDKKYKSSAGIDVSSHQGKINWKNVKNDGIEFAMIRAGYRGYKEGNIVEDKMFSENISNALQEGIEVGVYFFSQAITTEEAKEEARFVLDLIKDYSIKYPVAFDMEIVGEEDRINNISNKKKTKIAKVFCDEIKNSGYKSMVYGNLSWLGNIIDLTSISQHELWLAQYSHEPHFPYKFSIWQYTDEGNVKGIKGNVDLNLSFEPITK